MGKQKKMYTSMQDIHHNYEIYALQLYCSMLSSIYSKDTHLQMNLLYLLTPVSELSYSAHQKIISRC